MGSVSMQNVDLDSLGQQVINLILYKQTLMLVWRGGERRNRRRSDKNYEVSFKIMNACTLQNTTQHFTHNKVTETTPSTKYNCMFWLISLWLLNVCDSKRNMVQFTLKFSLERMRESSKIR